MGDSTTLMFTPLEESWFLEEGHSDLEIIKTESTDLKEREKNKYWNL